MQYAGDRKCLVSLKSVRLVFNEICPGTLVTEERRARQPYGGKKSVWDGCELTKGKTYCIKQQKKTSYFNFPSHAI
jgi:hypothetical protein